MNTLNSKDAANEAVLEGNKAIRVQPPAPNPTEYYYTKRGSWVKQLAGQDTTTSVDVDTVRQKVKYGVGKNESEGVDCLHAVAMDEVKQ